MLVLFLLSCTLPPMLQPQVDTLNDKVAALEAENTELQERVQDLEEQNARLVNRLDYLIRQCEQIRDILVQP